MPCTNENKTHVEQACRTSSLKNENQTTMEHEKSFILIRVECLTLMRLTLSCSSGRSTINLRSDLAPKRLFSAQRVL